MRSFYNEDGLRVRKTATSTGTTNYTLHGKNIVHLVNGKNSMHFFYDARNRPAVVTYNGVDYAYIYNVQGDVIALVDSTGSKVVEYYYDAWGKILSVTGTLATTLGTINPFRYRGYVFDEETGLYYLRSRFYNPSRERFVNGDKQLALTGCSIACNVYAYCRNCPIDQVDTHGTESQHFLLPAPWIGGIPTTYERYFIYESFMLKYREVSNEKRWTAPPLPYSYDCNEIIDVSYTISQKHIASLWQQLCGIVSGIGDAATLISEGGGAYAISMAATSMKLSLNPEAIIRVADWVSNACDAVGKYADLHPAQFLGHDHEVHVLRVGRSAIIKTVHEYQFEVCSTGECSSEMRYVTLYGWMAN